ncbi:MAG: enoyl-CoA hydratase/isomerase family protein [Roseovarius sp.]
MDDGIGRLTLNRPASLNTFTPGMTWAIIEATERLRDDSEVKLVVLSGAGRAFCTGADFNILDANRHRPEEIARFNRGINYALNAIEALPQPVIGSVHGHALGGGLEAMLVCDIVVAAKSTIIGDPHVEVSFPHGGGGSQRLPRRIGLARALDLALTCRRLTASAAMETGLVARVAPDAELTDTVDLIAREMAERNGATLREVKRLLHLSMRVDLSVGLQAEETAFAAHARRPDAFVGIDAFLARRARK